MVAAQGQLDKGLLTRIKIKKVHIEGETNAAGWAFVPRVECWRRIDGPSEQS